MPVGTHVIHVFFALLVICQLSWKTIGCSLGGAASVSCYEMSGLPGMSINWNRTRQAHDTVDVVTDICYILVSLAILSAAGKLVVVAACPAVRRCYGCFCCWQVSPAFCSAFYWRHSCRHCGPCRLVSAERSQSAVESCPPASLNTSSLVHFSNTRRWNAALSVLFWTTLATTTPCHSGAGWRLHRSPPPL